MCSVTGVPHAPETARSIWYRRAAWLLLALALLRGLQVVAGDPLLAVANNYDMIRVQACIDAWPARMRPFPRRPTAPTRLWNDIGSSATLARLVS
jgi:hypothetical protein